MYSTRFLDLPRFRSAGGVVRLPGSKSISNRVLLLAALCDGETRIGGLLDSDDTKVMLDALAALGCGLRREVGGELGGAWIVRGLGGIPPTSLRAGQPLPLFLGNAGTAMRPLCAALAIMGGDYLLSGVARMHERPIGDLVDALRGIGCRIDYLAADGFPPLRVGSGALRLNVPVRVRGDVSSQFLTALMLALPLAAQRATRDVVIEIEGELISKPYVDITLSLLERFGVAVRREAWRRFTIPAGSRLRSPGAIHVEADASSASYFIALGAIAGVDAPVRIEGVGADSIQGDIRFVEAARAMGALIEPGPAHLESRRGAWPLRAIDLDCNHIPDAAMTLAVMALYADGASTLRNIASWRVKETDRIAAMASELRKLGATVFEGADFLRIEPPARWRGATILTYDDHRMAMCFSLAAFNPAGAPVRIEDPQCVSKTFPDYFETLFTVAEAVAAPVITIDGPTASGKGTLASETARSLGWHYLDSGALYRVTGLAARRAGLAPEPVNEAAIAHLAASLPLAFDGTRVLLAGEDVGDAIRTEAAGMDASKVSALPAVRAALLHLQHAFRRAPGLVADGRDMGTVVFPDARLKVYLTAAAMQRAERRHKQLISKGIPATLDSLRLDLEARDARDSSRAAAPLKPAEDALLLDNSSRSVDESLGQVLRWWDDRAGVGSA